MRRFLLILSILSVLPSPAARCSEMLRNGRDSLLLMFWNLENFFDWKDEGKNGSDREFSSGGARHWTASRFYAKCNAVAKTVLWVSDRYGRLPDAIGFAEVENEFVVRSIVSSTVLRKLGYRWLHFDSTDPRGIDVTLVYRPSVLDCKLSYPVHIRDSLGNILPTRDILFALFSSKSGEEYGILINHHPSKYGGAASSGRRRMALGMLRSMADSLAAMQANTIAAGDFNDTPDNPDLKMLDGVLVNKSDSLFRAGAGTIRYDGRWELIDMFWTSPALEQKTVMDIVRAPFLLARDKKHPGEKPLRTWSGPAYLGGVSDHLPIVLEVRPIGK